MLCALTISGIEILLFIVCFYFTARVLMLILQRISILNCSCNMIVVLLTRTSIFVRVSRDWKSINEKCAAYSQRHLNVWLLLVKVVIWVQIQLNLEKVQLVCQWTNWAEEVLFLSPSNSRKPQIKKHWANMENYTEVIIDAIMSCVKPQGNLCQQRLRTSG